MKMYVGCYSMVYLDT